MNEPVAPAARSSATSEGERRRYRAFICYSHRDENVARWLHHALERYRVPSRLRGTLGEFGPLPDRLTPIFRDREDLASSGELAPRIRAALESSEALVVICSSQAAVSPWVNAEVLAFKQLGRGHRVYPLIVEGEPGDAAHECFAPALRFELEGDGRLGSQPAEPLAADLRPGKDGKSLALLKILSGLLGVDLDSLRQREAVRRHRRLLAVTAAALAMACITSFLAVQAVVARHAAERRQKQSEALVDFMLGDLNDKLARVSRLDVLETVDDRAMDYFQSLPTTDVSDQTLEQRARALTRIGGVRRDQGHLPQAMAAFEAAARLSGPLAQAQPADVASQLAYADDLAFVGTAHWYQGDLAGAQTSFASAQAVLERARTVEPRNSRTLFQLATLDNNIGHVLESLGQLDAAQAQYQRMFAECRSLTALDAANTDWQELLGLSHNNLAKMALLRGDLVSAIANYRADVAIESALAANDRNDNSLAERQALAQGALGRTLALAGDVPGGVLTLRQALSTVSRLHAADSGDTSFAEDVALYSYQLAGLLLKDADVAGARDEVAAALGILQGMIKQDPANIGWQREMAEARIAQAAVQQVDGQEDAARTSLQSALSTLAPMLARQPHDRPTVLAAAQAQLALADLDPRNAEELRRQAKASLIAQTNGLGDPRLRVLQVRSNQIVPSPVPTEPRIMAKLTHAPAFHRP